MLETPCQVLLYYWVSTPVREIRQCGSVKVRSQQTYPDSRLISMSWLDNDLSLKLIDTLEEWDLGVPVWWMGLSTVNLQRIIRLKGEKAW